MLDGEAQVSEEPSVRSDMSILRSLLLAGVAAFAAATPASAAVNLPTVTRSLTAAVSSPSCQGAASATTTWTAPMAGFMTARLTARGGEWDLFLADARSRRSLSQSRAFGAQEVSQTWVAAGQQVVISGCRAAGNVSLATLTIDFTDAAKPVETKASVIRTGRLSQGIFQALQQRGFDAAEMTRTKRFTDIFIPSQAKLAAFKKLGVPFTMRVADLAARDAAARKAEAARAASGVRSAVPSGRQTYRFLADYQADMKRILDANPAIAKPITIGTTYQGRPIQGIEFSDDVNASDDGKPTYFVVGNHHAREWPSSEMNMELMLYLADKYGDADAEGVRVTNILKNVRIVVVPILNVDGFVTSRGESAAQAQIGAIPDPEDETIGQAVEPVLLGGAFAYRRKNCDGAVPNANTDVNAGARNAPCYYQYGVDPNRNYGFDWGGPGASTDPTTQTYRGTSQWSEPETQAVWRTSQNRPVTVLLTLHTVAALVLRSPGLKSNGLAPDETLLRELGDKIGSNTGYKSQYGWQLYDTTGTTEDWNYGAAGSLGYTIELGPSGGDFHGDYKTAVEGQWVGPRPSRTVKGGGMKEAFLTAAEYAFDPKTHSVITGSGAPAGAELEVKKTFETKSSPLCTFAQGYLVAGSVISPLDCVAQGATGQVSTQDGLTYTTQVKPDGTFRWHITQSTRPFEGYTYNATTGLPESKGVKESWTLTCKVDGQVVGAPKVFEIERGDQRDFGNPCA